MSMQKRAKQTGKALAILSLTAAMLLGATASTNTVYAATTNTASGTTVKLMQATSAVPTSKTLKKVNRKVCVNGKYLSGITVLDVNNGTTLLPVRAIAESLNCQVQYDKDNKVAIVLSGDSTIELPLGYTFGVINGQKTPISNNASSVVYNSTTYLPVRYVSTALNCSITYDKASQTVVITTSDFTGNPLPPAPPTAQVTPATTKSPVEQAKGTGTSPQDCVTNNVSFEEIDPSYLTKRLTPQEWLKLCPDLKGKDLTLFAKHECPVSVHVALKSTRTDFAGKEIVAFHKYGQSPAAISIGYNEPVIYFKDGTYTTEADFPGNKNLEDVAYMAVNMYHTNSNTSITIFITFDQYPAN